MFILNKGNYGSCTSVIGSPSVRVYSVPQLTGTSMKYPNIGTVVQELIFFLGAKFLKQN